MKIIIFAAFLSVALCLPTPKDEPTLPMEKGDVEVEVSGNLEGINLLEIPYSALNLLEILYSTLHKVILI